MVDRTLVYLSRFSNEHISLALPCAEGVFTSWLKSRGWDIDLSTPGRVAKQMLRQVGGTWGLSLLARPRLIKLLRRIEDGKTLNEVEVRAEARRIANEDEFGGDATNLIRTLTEHDIIRLGIEMQCPVCRHHLWRSLDALDYNVRCEKCTGEFTIRTSSPRDLKWTYRAYGPFGLRGAAYGAYAVLLTLRFFARVLEASTTPMLSFTVEGIRGLQEVDLGLFYQKTIGGRVRRELIFAECKASSASSKKDVKAAKRRIDAAFSREDVVKMKNCAGFFPGSVIVFATLKEHLTSQEIKLIRPLANRGRRYWRDNRSYNPVLILTATELCCNYLGINRAWEKKGGLHRDLARRYRHQLSDLLPLCDATQQLYLDMSSFGEWHRERWERRLARKKRETAD